MLAGASAGAPYFPLGAALELKPCLFVLAGLYCSTVTVGATHGHGHKADPDLPPHRVLCGRAVVHKDLWRDSGATCLV